MVVPRGSDSGERRTPEIVITFFTSAGPSLEKILAYFSVAISTLALPRLTLRFQYLR